MTPRDRELAQLIWNYHRLNHSLEKADAILVLCSHDEAVAKWAAKLFLDQWAPLLIFSGGSGTVTRTLWHDAEADRFAHLAIAEGVPAHNILVENRSTNTGENVAFTRALLAERRIDPEKFILVQKPYMERRSYATFKKHWAEKPVIVSSPPVSFDVYLAQYACRELSAHEVVSIMVGDLQRIKVYAEKGFQIPQSVPEEVWSAFTELVRSGYNTHLVPG